MLNSSIKKKDGDGSSSSSSSSLPYSARKILLPSITTSSGSISSTIITGTTTGPTTTTTTTRRRNGINKSRGGAKKEGGRGRCFMMISISHVFILGVIVSIILHFQFIRVQISSFRDHEQHEQQQQPPPPPLLLSSRTTPSFRSSLTVVPNYTNKTTTTTTTTTNNNNDKWEEDDITSSSTTKTKPKTITTTTTNNDDINNNNIPTTTKKKNKLYNGYSVDIISVGSNNRPMYWKTQRDTWGTHSLIRNFFVVTEDNDYDFNCTIQNTSITKQWKDTCRTRYQLGSTKKTKTGGSTTTKIKTTTNWLMNRYVHQLMPEIGFSKKINPVAWLCAQTRFPLALSTTILGYQLRNETLPDYLLMIDDDTYYDMDLYYESVIQKQKSSKKLLVTSGCRASIARRNDFSTFPIGGFGTTFSKGSLQRFLQPIYYQQPQQQQQQQQQQEDLSLSSWEKHFKKTLEANLLFEQPSYQYGMNLIELIDNYTKKEKISNMNNWTRGYCFHGDWIIALFVMLYDIGGIGPMIDTIDNSIANKANGLKGNCRNQGSDNCTGATSLVCHYQTPNDFRRLEIEKKESRKKKKKEEEGGR